MTEEVVLQYGGISKDGSSRGLIPEGYLGQNSVWDGKNQRYFCGIKEKSRGGHFFFNLRKYSLTMIFLLSTFVKMFDSEREFGGKE